MALWLDDDDHPVHVMTFPARYSYAELERAMSELREYYVERDRNEPSLYIGLAVDLSRVERSEARNRKLIADTMTRLVPIVHRSCAGTAYVVRSQLVRAALTATLWLRSPPWPTRVFTSRLEAIGWLRDRLADGRADRVR